MRRLILAVVVIALLVRHGRRGADFYSDFRDLSALDGRIAMLAKEHPDVAHARTLGTSGEGRPIEAVEVSRGGNTEIVIAGGQHAREWIAAMAPMCVAERLATEPRYRSLLERFSFVIVPVVNPDGYAYTWTTDRNWRKSRRDGHGVDLNRNYSLAWGGADSSDDKSASTYRGSAPFSEPETRAMRDLVLTDRPAAAIDFHSFSQVITYPWSYQRTEPGDRELFATTAARIATAMNAAHGMHYEVRPGSSLRVGASGTFGDWAYAHGALSFLIELRPASSAGGGFVLPPDQIVPTCDEALAAVLALTKSL